MADVDELKERRETIYDMMQYILSSINNVFSEHGVALPASQYLDMGGQGETVHTCTQMTVSFEQMYNGAVGNPDQIPTRCDGPRTATFVVELVRCVPTMKQAARGAPLTPPTNEELTEATKQQVVDAWLLMDGGLTVADKYTIAGGLADVLVGPESGGYQAVILNLVLSLQ